MCKNPEKKMAVRDKYSLLIQLVPSSKVNVLFTQVISKSSGKRRKVNWNCKALLVALLQRH